MNFPLVSVIIPTYKNVDLLPLAVESVLKQTYENIEIIVVDDNYPNSDFRKNTEQIMKKYQNENKVIYIQNTENSERSTTRNNGARCSHGKYLMFLDNDDLFFSQKVEAQVAVLENRENDYAVSYSDYVRCKNGKVVVRCGEMRDGDLLLDALARNLFVHPGSNLMIKRDAFFEVGGFNEDMYINEDIDLLVRLLRKYKMVYSNVIGLQISMHDQVIRDFDYEGCTKKYIETEKDIIASLTDEQQEKVLKIIGLQLYRFYLSKLIDRKRVSEEYHLTKIDKYKFILYLIKRKISHKAFSFEL